MNLLQLSLPTLVMLTGIVGLLGVSGLSSIAPRRTTSPGWVSGNPASLAISGVADCLFDLGDDWQQYDLLQIHVKGSQAYTSIVCYGGEDATAAWPLSATTGSALAMTLTAAGTTVATAVPSGRFVRVVLTNGATAQDATAAVRITANA